MGGETRVDSELENSIFSSSSLDEIDGAPVQSIDFLIKFVGEKAANNSNAKGKNKTKNMLRRPIICICNDMYVPALRQLRQVAFVVSFPQMESGRLADR